MNKIQYIILYTYLHTYTRFLDNRFLIRLVHPYSKKNFNYCVCLGEIEMISISPKPFQWWWFTFFCSNDCLLSKSSFLKDWKWLWANLIKQKCQQTLCVCMYYLYRPTSCYKPWIKYSHYTSSVLVVLTGNWAYLTFT